MHKILLLGLVTIFSLSVLQYSNAETVNLNPLVLKQPDDFSITIDTTTYNYVVNKNAFLAVDDDGKTPTISCTIESIRLLTQSYHNYFKWTLSAGEYEVYCEIEDTTGRSTDVSWSVEIIRDVLAPSWFKTIAGWYSSNVIDQEIYLKIIKYFHSANVLEFDIMASNVVDNPRAPYSFQSNTGKWVSGVLANTNYKSILEDMAADGVFLDVTF